MVNARRTPRRRNTTRRRRRRARARLVLMMMSLAVVTGLMAALTVLITATSTADTSTSQTSSTAGPGPSPSATNAPVCGTASATPAPATLPPSAASHAQAPASAGSRSAPPNAPPPDTDLPCPVSGVLYSHSWYITDPNGVAGLGAADAKWLSRETAGTSCPREFLTVLDFGHPTRKFAGQDSPVDAYAMTLFGYRDTWRTYREIEQLAERYLDDWIGAISACPRLILVLGANNYGECQYAAGSCSVATAGQYWDVVAHDVMDYVAAKGYGGQVTGVWVGDDLETSWDPWPTTARFLNAVQEQEHTYATHAQLVDYGDAHEGVCSLVTGSCRAPWTAENIHDAAWGIGWDLPLPELYSQATAGRWESVARAFPDMQYRGIMTECAGSDPLPLDGCLAGSGDSGTPTPTSGSCEWTPTIAFDYALRFAQSMGSTSPPLYATNIQWLPSGNPSGGDVTASASCS